MTTFLPYFFSVQQWWKQLQKSPFSCSSNEQPLPSTRTRSHCPFSPSSRLPWLAQDTRANKPPQSSKIVSLFSIIPAKPHWKTTKTIPISHSQSDLTHNKTQTPIHFLIIPARSSKLRWTKTLPLFTLSVFYLFCRSFVSFTPVNKSPSPFPIFSSKQLHNKLQEIESVNHRLTVHISSSLAKHHCLSPFNPFILII